VPQPNEKSTQTGGFFVWVRFNIGIRSSEKTTRCVVFER